MSYLVGGEVKQGDLTIFMSAAYQVSLGMTDNFCDGGISVDFDHCFAAERVPKDYANIRGVGMQCSRQVHWSGVPEHLSRPFTNERAKQAVAAEWFARNFLRQQQR